MNNILKLMKEILEIEVEDGVKYATTTIVAEEINERATYQGVRIYCEAQLEKARMRIHFDIGFGDEIVPKPLKLDFPILLSEIQVPELLTYIIETAIAEKFEAIVSLGYINSRMKDFYDILHLSNNNSFKATTLGNRNYLCQ